MCFCHAVGPPRHQPGKIAEYVPEETHAGGTPYSSRNSAGARQVYDSSVGKGEEKLENQSFSLHSFEPLHEKTNNLHMRKQRRRSASR